MRRAIPLLVALGLAACTGGINGTTPPNTDAGASQQQPVAGSCVSDPDRPGSTVCDWTCTTAGGVTTCSKGAYDVPGGSASQWSCTDGGEFTQCTSVSGDAPTNNPGWDCTRDGNGKIVCIDRTPDQPSGGGPWVCVYDDVRGVVCTSQDSGTGSTDAGTAHDGSPLDAAPAHDASPLDAAPAHDARPIDATPQLCLNGTVNNEPEILVAYSPANGQSVGAGGQIKVWVTDEAPAIIAPNEQVDPTTGVITAPGDRSAKAPDGYLWEPAVYIAPQTAENGGTPHFPAIIKGHYNNNPSFQFIGWHNGPAIDPLPAGSGPLETFSTEFIWEVNSLGLGPGTYVAEFVIGDGDNDRGVGCINIVIQ